MQTSERLSKRAATLLSKLSPDRLLCARTDPTADGIEKGGLQFWIEPTGKAVGPSSARELIEKGSVIPANDGLFGASQSWRAP